MTAIAQAMRQAGYVSPDERLREVLDAAIAEAEQNRIVARSIVRKGVSDDAELLIALAGQMLDYLIDRALSERFKVRFTESREGGQSGRAREGHATFAPAPAHDRAGEGRCRNAFGQQDAASSVATPNGGSGHAGAALGGHTRDATPAVPRRGIEAIRTAAPAMAQCVLDTMRVNGKPIGDNTPDEALPVAANKDRDAKELAHQARIIRALCHGVPPASRIRDHVNPQEAERRARLATEVIDGKEEDR